ncbi:hypothetical protein MAH3_15250 [Sessilibacter sp. MAH3]
MQVGISTDISLTVIHDYNVAKSMIEKFVDERITHWTNNNILTPAEIDCATAVMLKILDGKCKMPSNEKIIMQSFYIAVKNQEGLYLDHSYHEFIEPFLELRKEEISEEKILEIYEKRVLAETQISRPVMKKFKSRLRQEGILPEK